MKLSVPPPILNPAVGEAHAARRPGPDGATAPRHAVPVGESAHPAATAARSEEESLFHAPSHGKAGGGRRGRSQRARPAPLRRRKAGGPRHADTDEAEELHHDETHSDEEARRLRLVASMHLEHSNRDGSQESNQHEGQRQDRKFAAISASRVALVADKRDPESLGSLLSAVRSSSSVEHVSPLMRRLILDAPSGLSALVLRIARDWLANRDAGLSGGSLSLASLRRALMEGAASSQLPVDERLATALVWLPAFLLNLDRPRTPAQREQAIDRLEMLERLAGARAGSRR